MKIEWEEYKPQYGPPRPSCEIGPEGHEWRLTISEGQVDLISGCEQCYDAVFGYSGGEDVEMQVEVVGKMTSHLETYGWETPECDHWWVFEPSHIEIGEPIG